MTISKGQITVFDTAIATTNVGDEIIMDSVNNVIHDNFGHLRICRVASHDKIGVSSLSLIRDSDFAVVGGSNILSSEMNKYKQWKIGFFERFFIKNNVLLLGVGWRQYQKATNLYTKSLLKGILTTDALHSVRDNYTLEKLRSIGFKNVINTGCPTTWKLTKDHCSQIPKLKSTKVIFTLTDYDKDFARDKHLIDVLFKSYENVYYWPQGRKDHEYLESLNIKEKVNIIAPNLMAYDNFLKNNDCDFIGTRLHGGVRALQWKRRSIIIGIDNRAIEKKKDFNLPVIERAEIENIEQWINGTLITDIKLPLENIGKWKSQFK